MNKSIPNPSFVEPVKVIDEEIGEETKPEVKTDENEECEEIKKEETMDTDNNKPQNWFLSLFIDFTNNINYW